MSAYYTAILKYANDDMAENVPMNNTEGPVCYLPHPAVVREERFTKIRVVFDAAAQARGYASLNKSLYSSPNVNADFVGFLLKFCTHRIALVADIEKVFCKSPFTNRTETL